MVLKMTISKAWAMDFVWSSVGNFLLYAKFSLSGGIQHGVLNIRYINCVSRMNACKQNTITLPVVPIFGTTREQLRDSGH